MDWLRRIVPPSPSSSSSSSSILVSSSSLSPSSSSSSIHVDVEGGTSIPTKWTKWTDDLAERGLRSPTTKIALTLDDCHVTVDVASTTPELVLPYGQIPLAVQADAAWPLKLRGFIAYFELHVVNLPSDSVVAIGLAQGSFPPSTALPGFYPRSYGYHSNTGNTSEGEYGPSYKEGDVVGCGINNMRELYFTLNGRSLGVAHVNVDISQPLYPTVGITGPAALKGNFGWSDFVFDITSQIAFRTSLSRPDIFVEGQRTTIDQLPDELLMKILNETVSGPRSTYELAVVCRKWQRACTDNSMWQPWFMTRWPNQSPNVKLRSWFNFYKRRYLHQKELGMRNAHPIENCEWEFKCPLSWESLTPTSSTTRYCASCEKDVHWVNTQEELQAAVAKGLCVALRDQSSLISDLIDDIILEEPLMGTMVYMPDPPAPSGISARLRNIFK